MSTKGQWIEDSDSDSDLDSNSELQTSRKSPSELISAANSASKPGTNVSEGISSESNSGVSGDIPTSSAPPAKSLHPGNSDTHSNTSTEPVKRVRDAWMVDESFDFSSLAGERGEKRTGKKLRQEAAEEAQRRQEEFMKKNQEYFARHKSEIADTLSFTFGDAGSSWRMMKLKNVYTAAKETGRSVEEIGVERFGTLRDFKAVCEEREELRNRKKYGEHYAGRKEKPSWVLQEEKRKIGGEKELQREAERETPVGGTSVGEVQSTESAESVNKAPSEITTEYLNRLRAQLLRAQLKHSPDVEKLQKEYDEAVRQHKSPASKVSPSSATATAPSEQNIRLVTGLDAELLHPVDKPESEMTPRELLHRERLLARQDGGRPGRSEAESLARDAGFSTDLDYMDENAEKLAQVVERKQENLRNMVVNDMKRYDKILSTCPLCLDREGGAGCDVISIATRVFLCLAPEPELAKQSVCIVPINHYECMLDCDEDEDEEVRNYMKCLIQFYDSQSLSVLFYENAVWRGQRKHAYITAVPVPRKLFSEAPAVFRETVLAYDEEWAQHQKIINTQQRAEKYGRKAFRASIAKEAPYFHVWFDINGGLGHIVEDTSRWPRGDLFAREAIGAVLGVEPHIVKKQPKWRKDDSHERRLRLEQRWKPFDWTSALH